MPVSSDDVEAHSGQRRERLAGRIRLLFRFWSPIYDSVFFQEGYYRRVHRRLLGALPAEEPSDVLDVGCGTGELLRAMAHKWPDARLVGLDLSPHMLARASAKDFGGSDVQLVEGSVTQLPFDDAAFDLVTNTISSHFYEDIDAALGEVARVLRPGGRFVMASLTNGPLRLVQRELRALNASYRAPELLRERLEGAGLVVERSEAVAWPSWLFVCRRTSG